MATTADLTVALAQWLEVQGVGTWSPDGLFTSNQTAITAKAVPPSPDRVIALGPYTVSDTVAGHRVQGMQIRARGLPGRPLDVDELDDAIYAVLHGAEGLVLGGVKVHLAYRNSHGALGVDVNHRTESVANYYLLIDAPSAYTR